MEQRAFAQSPPSPPPLSPIGGEGSSRLPPAAPHKERRLTRVVYYYTNTPER